jgi:hypothetical protein
VIAPVVVGENVTTNVQLAPAANEVPQGVPPPDAAEKSPLAARARLIDVVSLFCTVTIWELLVVPAVQPPKVRPAGVKFNGRMAVPLAFKTSGLTEVLSLIAIDPFHVPVLDGVKVTVKVQEPPAAKVVTQPDEAYSPLADVLEILTDEALVFLTVTVVFAVCPTATLVKASDAGVKVNGEAIELVPVPLSSTRSGLN